MKRLSTTVTQFPRELSNPSRCTGRVFFINIDSLPDKCIIAIHPNNNRMETIQRTLITGSFTDEGQVLHFEMTLTPGYEHYPVDWLKDVDDLEKIKYLLAGSPTVLAFLTEAEQKKVANSGKTGHGKDSLGEFDIVWRGYLPDDKQDPKKPFIFFKKYKGPKPPHDLIVIHIGYTHDESCEIDGAWYMSNEGLTGEFVATTSHA